MKNRCVDLIYKVCTLVKDIIDVPLLVNMTLYPHNQEIKNAGIKTICEITECADLEGVSNHIKR